MASGPLVTASVLLTTFLSGCVVSGEAVDSEFLSDRAGCSQDVWRLETFQHELTVGGTAIKVALDSDVTKEQADELLAIIGDANRLLPNGILAPKDLHVLICNAGPTSYATTFAETPLIVTSARIQFSDKPTGLDVAKAALLHEYGHVVFDKFLAVRSEGYAAYQRLNNQYVNKIEELQGLSPQDQRYFALRRELQALRPENNNYHQLSQPFVELVADTFTVATMNDGEAVSKIFTGIREAEEHALFRDFTKLHLAANTPYENPYFTLAPTRSELWRRFGDAPKEPWSEGLPAIFSTSAEVLDSWVSNLPRDDFKTADALNRAVLGRLANQ